MLDLPARGLRNRAGPHEDHACRPVAARTMDAARDLADQIVEVVGRGVLAAHFGDDVQPLRAGALAVDADGGGVADTVQAIDDLLDVGRDDVLAAEDDEVPLSRPVTKRYPSASRSPRSPVLSQPPGMSTFAVASGLL